MAALIERARSSAFVWLVDNTIARFTEWQKYLWYRGSYAYETPVINSLHAQNICTAFTSVREQPQRATRARELVDAYPTVHVPGVACDTPSAWLGHRTHIRAARTEIYAIGCEAYIVAFYRRSTVPRVRIERARTARSARHHLPIYRSTYRERDRRSFTPVDRRHLLYRRHVLLTVYESYETRHLEK